MAWPHHTAEQAVAHGQSNAILDPSMALPDTSWAHAWPMLGTKLLSRTPLGLGSLSSEILLSIRMIWGPARMNHPSLSSSLLGKNECAEQFEAMYSIAQETDASFLGAVKAQEVKQLKGLEHLEKRLLKAQKKKLSDHVKRFTSIQNELFPQENLQERVTNFSEFYLHYGKGLIPQLFEALDPLDYRFTVVTQ